jgi:hypothetical protein
VLKKKTAVKNIQYLQYYSLTIGISIYMKLNCYMIFTQKRKYKQEETVMLCVVVKESEL